MKPSRKSHYVGSDRPVTFDGKLIALCGVEIEKPVLIPAWDDTPTGEKFDFNTLSGCRKCVEKLAELAGVTYLVSVRNGKREDKD